MPYKPLFSAPAATEKKVLPKKSTTTGGYKSLFAGVEQKPSEIKQEAPTPVAKPQVGTFQPSMLRKDYKAPVQLPQAQISAIDPNNRPIPTKPQTIATPPKLKSGLGDLARSTVATAGSQIASAVKFAKDVAIKPPKILGQGVADFAKKANAPLSNFVDKYAGKAKEYAEAVNQPSREWNLDEIKKDPKAFVYENAPQVAGSLLPYLANPILGMATAIGSTAEDVKQKAVKAGMDEDNANKLSLVTGVAVGLLDRIVPSKYFGTSKNKFVEKLANNWVTSALTEGGTEVSQEAIQLLAEKTFRKDLGWDEAKTRTTMAGILGVLGGSGIHAVGTMINGATSPAQATAPTEQTPSVSPPTATPSVVAQEAVNPQEVVSTPKETVEPSVAKIEEVTSLPIVDTNNVFAGQSKKAREEPIKTKIIYNGSDSQNALIDSLLSAKAGERIGVRNEDTAGMSFTAIKSSFPKWIPPELRVKSTVDAVANHIFEGTLPKKVAEKRLYNLAYEQLNGKRDIKEDTSNPFEPTQPITPTKSSGVAKSIEAKAIEKRLTESFGDIAQYTPTTIKEQVKLAEDVFTDVERVKRIVKGEEALPNGLLGGSFIVAVEDYLSKNDDPQLALDLANSDITSETSVHAQEMRMLAERNPDSAVAKIQELKKARQEQSKKQADPTPTLKKIIKVAKAKATKESWSSFISAIEC
jgi:hypothetical protein